MDEAVVGSFENLAKPHREAMAVLALGGYGRGELFPHSDVDLMVLCPSGTRREEASEAAKVFLHSLWDAGVNVGHSVRTPEEALELHGSSLDSWTSMLESRFLAGSPDLAASLRQAMQRRSAGERDSWFVGGIMADLQAREERYGNSVKLLEPNIKKSAGGLRDLQAVFWLYRSADAAWPADLSDGIPATRGFLEDLSARGLLETDVGQRLLNAHDFMLRTRHEMHYQRGALNDTLDYSLQVAVAEALGYGREAELRPVEVFMRDYYLHARAIHRMKGQLLERFRPSPTPPQAAAERIGGALVASNGRLTLAEGKGAFATAEELFGMFVVAAEHDLSLEARARAAVERGLGLFTEEETRSPVLAGMMRRILQSGRVADTLREMYEVGVLERYVPEFGRLVAFFQHNVYHYYTADEHTMIALANAERLRYERGVLHEVYRILPRRDILWLAILLHDIAKPLGVADHEVTGVEVARGVLERLGMEDAIGPVSFLIRHHLLMEQVAFRRNIHDPSTIREFADVVREPDLLDYLYVLTYADLSAVNVNVWTDWKASMLEDLYRLTSEVLRRQLRGHDIEAFHRERHDAVRADIVEALSATFSPEEVRRHFEAIGSDAYAAVFSEEEIAAHLREIRTGVIPATVVRQHEAYSELTVIGHDAPFALSRCCAVFSANDATIFDANVFTREDGILIDRFRVAAAHSGSRLEERTAGKISSDMAAVLEGTLDVAELFRAHHRKWKRRPRRPVNPSIRTGVEFEDAGAHTIIDVYAPDSVGFLYRVTETISQLGLDIEFARIATRVDGIVDAFYVRERSGGPVTAPARRAEIRERILKTIRTMSELELSEER
jgi:[protein-PII] uridylyltransferase